MTASGPQNHPNPSYNIGVSQRSSRTLPLNVVVVGGPPTVKAQDVCITNNTELSDRALISRSILVQADGLESLIMMARAQRNPDLDGSHKLVSNFST